MLTQHPSIQKELEQKLRDAFQPHYLQVSNESHLHGGAPRDPNRVRETHFKAVVVADTFANKRMVQQHQLVYKALADSMQKIHALGLHTFTPDEWIARGCSAADSPECPKRERDDHS
jgi:BolA family transcriptional regulator, general stress-responsive regulator